MQHFSMELFANEMKRLLEAEDILRTIYVFGNVENVELRMQRYFEGDGEYAMPSKKEEN